MFFYDFYEKEMSSAYRNYSFVIQTTMYATSVA